MAKKPLSFVDAQEMHKTYPSTFEAPSHDELSVIEPGWFVKVSAGQERFWVEVTEVNGDDIKGRIDNDLIFTKEHGLVFNQVIDFKKCNCYSLMEPKETQADIPKNRVLH